MLPIALLSKKNLTSRLAIRHFQRVTVRLSLGLVVATSPGNQDPNADPGQDTLRRLGSAAYAFNQFLKNARRPVCPHTPERGAEPPTHSF